MKYAREGRRPTNDYVKAYQELVEEELRALEADELVAKIESQDIPQKSCTCMSPKGRTLQGATRGMAQSS
eukprot:2330533-Lingulodinium_polyedra.AAC.1